MKRFAILLLILAPLQIVRGAPCAANQTDAPRAGGYCQQGLWIPGIVSRRTYNAIPPQFVECRAVYQARGLLEETAHDHKYSGDEDYIAFVMPAAIGWHGFIQMPDDPTWYPVRVADVSRREDLYMEAVYMGACIELNYDMAQRLGVVDHINADGSRYVWGVKFCAALDHPELVCTGAPPLFLDWFKSILRFEG